MTRIRAAFNDPDGERHGIPTYWWRGAPPEYATRRQLRARGLQPARQDIAAQILWHGVGGTRAAHLFRVDRARPKKPPTPGQLRAVEAMLRARRTCKACGEIRDYYIPRSLGVCLTCDETEPSNAANQP